jgi:hypothetical protein
MECGATLLKKNSFRARDKPFFYLLRASPQAPVGAASLPQAPVGAASLPQYTRYTRFTYAHNTAPTALTAVVAVLAVSLAPPMNSGADSSLFSINIGLKKKNTLPVVSVATNN